MKNWWKKFRIRRMCGKSMTHMYFHLSDHENRILHEDYVLLQEEIIKKYTQFYLDSLQNDIKEVDVEEVEVEIYEEIIRLLNKPKGE